MFPMTITISNQTQLDAVLAAFVQPLREAPVAAAAKPAAKVEPRKEAAPTSAQETAAPAATPSTAPAAAAPETKAEASAPTLTYDQVAEKIREVARKKGNDKAKALLADFKVSNGQQLKPEQWPDVVKGCDALLKD